MATILKRRGKWRAQVRRAGHSLSKTFHRKCDAEVWTRETEVALDNDALPAPLRLTKVDTFANLIDLHIADLEEVGATLGRSKEHVLTRSKSELGALHIPDLSRERLIRYGRERAGAGAGPATLAIDISFIGTVLTHAAAIHGIKVDSEAVRLARVALRRLGLVGPSEERDRRPTQTEIDRLCEHFDGNPRQLIPMSRVIQFAIASAMRLDEIFRIQWTTLDERSRTVLVEDRKDPRKKSGNDQRVPLLDATGYDAWTLLADQRELRLNKPECFPYNPKSAGTAFQRAVRDLQTVDLHFHDLRHEATSRLFEAGLTIEQVPLVTGHKDWKMLKRYTQLRPEALYSKLNGALKL